MNKYVLQLLKKFAGIDIDELQAEFNRVQGENVKISTQLRHASDKISSMEKQISRLEAEATAYQTSVRENEEKHQKTMGEICLQNKELNSHIDEKDELIKQLQKDISDKEKALEDLQEKYNQLNNSLKAQQDSYEEKIKNLHQDTDTSLQQKEQNLLNARQQTSRSCRKKYAVLKLNVMLFPRPYQKKKRNLKQQRHHSMKLLSRSKRWISATKTVKTRIKKPKQN